MGKNTEFQPQAKRLHIDLTHTELERSNQNHGAEIEIGEFQKSFRQKMVRKQDPKRVWVYGLVHQAGVLNQISRGKTGRTGIEELTGKTPDISEWLDFDFYGQVWWLDKNHPATTDDNISGTKRKERKNDGRGKIIVRMEVKQIIEVYDVQKDVGGDGFRTHSS